LGHPTPNPTKGAVTLQLDLPEEASVDLAVYDLTGRKVAQIVAGSLPAGIHRPRWDTFDAQGGPLGQGIYFARLVVNGQRVAQRSLVIVR
jgi:hypothetical protein